MDELSEIKEQENLQKQAIKLKKEKVIKGITCPACSGELDLREGIRSFNCKYCGTLLTTKGISGPIKFYVPKKVTREKAIEFTKNWLGKGLAKERGLKDKAVISDVFLTFIPYWRVKADVVGWVFGQEKRTRRVNNRTETYYVDVEKKIQKSFDQTFAACDISELGVHKVNLEGDELLPVDFENLESQGMLFNIISSEVEVASKAKDEFAKVAEYSAFVDRISFKHYDLVREDIHIVYYPLWVVRYSFAERTYQVVIDGEDGSVCYGKAPGNNLYRAVTGILGVGVGMYLATLFAPIGFIGELDEGAFIFYLVALVLGIFIILWGWKKFRYGGEIEEGSGISKEKDQGKKILKNLPSVDTMAMVKNTAGSAALGLVAGAIFNSFKK